MKLNEIDIIKLLESDTFDEKILDKLSKDDDKFIKFASFKARYLEFKKSEKEKTPLEYLQKLSNDFPELNTILPKDEKKIKESKDTYISPKVEEPPVHLIDQNIKRINKQTYIYGIIATFIIGFLFFNPLKNNQTYHDFRHISKHDLRGIMKHKYSDSPASKESIDKTLDLNRSFNTDLSNKTKQEIVDFSRDSRIQVQITYGKQFSQIPKVGEEFNIQTDTLKVTIKR